MRIETEINKEYNLILDKEDGRIYIDALVLSIKERILQHRKYIKRSRKSIEDYSDVIDVVNSEAAKIESRMAKVDELREMVDHFFSIKIN